MVNSKNTKRAFLASALSVVLCTAMFVGSTFAWFTDSATTGMNKIQAGNLKIALQTKDDSGKWVDVGEDPLAFVQLKENSGKDILWEPGCTYKLPELRVANEGNLALKFKLLVNGLSGTENAEAEIADLAEVIDVYTGTAKTDVVEEKKLGTLRELMGDPDGAAYGVILPEGAALPEGADKTVVVGATDGYNLLFHMQEAAGNKYQDMNLSGISFTLTASQYTYEKDSFDDQYDKAANSPTPVATAGEMAAALAKGEDVVLTAPIQMPEILEVTGDVTIYGSEKGQLLVPDNADRVINVNNNTEPLILTLSGVDVVGPTSGTYTRGVSVYNNKDVTIVADDSSISASYYALNIASNNENVNVIVKNTELEGWCAFQTWSAGTKATFENCTLIGNNDKGYNADGWNNFSTVVINEDAPNTELTFKNCRIEANQTTGNHQYLLSARAAGAKVTVDGCTFFGDGKEIADADLGKYIDIFPAAADIVLTIDGTIINIAA